MTLEPIRRCARCRDEGGSRAGIRPPAPVSSSNCLPCTYDNSGSTFCGRCWAGWTTEEQRSDPRPGAICAARRSTSIASVLVVASKAPSGSFLQEEHDFIARRVS